MSVFLVRALFLFFLVHSFHSISPFHPLFPLFISSLLLPLVSFPLCPFTFYCLIFPFPPPPPPPWPLPSLPLCMLVFLLNLVRRQSVLLLYTSVLAPYLSLLDPWFFPFSSCSLLLLVTSVCFRFILCCHSTQSLFPSVPLSPILSSSYVFISMPVPSSHCSFQISPFPLLFNPLLCPELILSSTSIQSPFPPPQDQSFSSFLPFLQFPSQHPSIPFLVTSILPHQSSILRLTPSF